MDVLVSSSYKQSKYKDFHMQNVKIEEKIVSFRIIPKNFRWMKKFAFPIYF